MNKNLYTIPNNSEKIEESCRLANTFSNHLNNSTELGKSMSALSSAISPSMTELAQSMSALSSAISPSMTELSQSMSALSSTISPSMTELAQSMSALSSAISPSMTELGKSMSALSSAISPSMTELGKSMSALSSAISPSMTELGKSMSALSSAISPSMTELGKSMSALSSTISPSMIELGKSMSALSSTISVWDNNYRSTLLSIAEQSASMSAMATSLGSFDVISRQLKDVVEVVDELEQTNQMVIKEERTEYKTSLTEEDVKNIYHEMQSQQNQNTSPFKDIVRDILVTYGADSLKSIVNWLVITLYTLFTTYIAGSHYDIIDAIQNSIDNGIYVVGYISAKKYIKSERLASYENLNRIGILRVSSKVRYRDSKNSPFSSNVQLHKDTVVNIQSKNGKWIKIDVQIEDTIVEGWIEESKVIKFKKEQ